MTQDVGSTPRVDPLLDGGWRRYGHDRSLPPVLDAALDLFVRSGYHATTVRAIAVKAGMSVPGLYHHYASKQDMLAVLLRQSNDDVMARSRAAAVDAGDDPRDRFCALVENIVLFMTHRRRMAQLAHQIDSLEEPARQRHVSLRDELQRMVLNEVLEARMQGLFRIDEPEEATRAVLVLCRGVSEWYRPGGGKTPEQIAARYVRFALSLVDDVSDPS